MTTTDSTPYDPLAPAVLADPYPFYDVLRRDAPVFHVESLDAYAVSRYVDVRRVMHDHETFSSAAMADLVARPAGYARDANNDGVEPDENPSIVGADGATHARLRTIVNRGFSPRRIGELEDRMRQLARRHTAEVAAARECDLQATFAVPFPTVVIAEMLGVDPVRRDEFRQ